VKKIVSLYKTHYFNEFDVQYIETIRTIFGSIHAKVVLFDGEEIEIRHIIKNEFDEEDLI